MKVEVGKYYKTRDGRKVGPMKLWLEGPSMHADESKDSYDPDGKAQSFGENSEHDLIAEWTDTHSTGTLAELGVRPGDVVGIGNEKVTCVEVELSGNIFGFTHLMLMENKEFLWCGGVFDNAKWRIVSRAPDLSELDYAPINVEKPIYEAEPDTRPLEHFQSGPVITETVTRKRIVPGVYGRVSIHENTYDDGKVLIRLADGGGEVNLNNCGHYMSRSELIAARDILSQLIDAMAPQA